MGDIVNPMPDCQKLRDDHEFIVDLARFAEALTDESAIRKKYRLSDDVWNALGEDDSFVRLVTDEKTRRIRNGNHKKEKAQKLVVAAPEVAASIMNSVASNDRHRLDACKVLNDLAANPTDTPTTSDRFIITINLGSDHVERYDKSISINANDVAPSDAAPAQAARMIDRKPIAHEPDSCELDSAVAQLSTAQKLALKSFMEMEDV